MPSVAPCQEFKYWLAYIYVIGAAFWNFVGAGVFGGGTLNPPLVNYYEHGTFLTLTACYGKACIGRHQCAQKNVLMAETKLYSSSTSGMTCHLSNVVQGCEMPNATMSPTASGLSVGTVRWQCWSFSSVTT